MNDYPEFDTSQPPDSIEWEPWARCEYDSTMWRRKVTLTWRTSSWQPDHGQWHWEFVPDAVFLSSNESKWVRPR